MIKELLVQTHNQIAIQDEMERLQTSQILRLQILQLSSQWMHVYGDRHKKVYNMWNLWGHNWRDFKKRMNESCCISRKEYIIDEKVGDFDCAQTFT